MRICDVLLNFFVSVYNKLSYFVYKVCHSKVKCEKVILNNYEDYYTSKITCALLFQSETDFLSLVSTKL